MKNNNDKKPKNTSKLNDSELYNLYEELISSTYPSFLRKFGMKRTAKNALGAIITDSSGKKYIDCVSGYGLNNIGHNNPKIIRDIISQLNKNQLFTKPFITENQIKLAKMLADITPGDLKCSFLCNSGSEAVDNAIKLARLHSKNKQIITAINSFHGYTYGALSATGIVSFKQFFNPFVPDIIHVPFGDINALKKVISPDTAAILLEPIQHEAGIAIPSDDYFQKVRLLCDKNGVILILDEIKTGMGKTGTMFACESLGFVPDVLLLGKSLGGGIIPIGALIASKRLWKKFSFSFSMSSSSFAGNTLACRAAISTIRIIQKGNLLAECKKKEEIFLTSLKKLIIKYPNLLKNIKGKGLLLGLEAANSQKAFEISKQMIKQEVIVLPSYGNRSIIMIEPPLVISFKQIESVITAFNKACRHIDGK